MLIDTRWARTLRLAQSTTAHKYTKPRAMGHGAKNTQTHADFAEVEPLNLRQMAWDHIQRVLAEHDHNVSAAARSLGVHRRTLQRKLVKQLHR